MKTYIYKGQEISHTAFISLMSRNGIPSGYRVSHEEHLQKLASDGNEKAQALISDLLFVNTDDKKDTKQAAYSILAHNRNAKRPEYISPRQWAAVKTTMEKKFMKEWMDTPEGLYTSEQVWKQTFNPGIEQVCDVVFNDENDSNSKGFAMSYDDCLDYIKMNNGTNDSYFADYKGGTVSIVNGDGETLYEEIVR